MKKTNIEENIKNRVIDLIGEGSENRLIAFKPDDKSGVVSLIVKKRGEYKPPVAQKRLGASFETKRTFSAPPEDKSQELSFQVHIFIGPSNPDNIVKDIARENIIVDKNFYLMFIYFDEVRQYVSNIWIIPSLMFLEIAESQKLENNKTILKFKITTDEENKNKYAKFLIDQKELGNFFLEIINSKSNIDFDKKIFKDNKDADLKQLEKFISEARENTYAADLKSIENPRLFGSLQSEYQKEYYSYQDIYFTGSKIFVGQEVVYYDNRPIWAMNYLGTVIEKETLAFLKESLLKLSQECRMGKICEFEKKEFKYQDNGQGNLEYFSGKEQIFKKNKDIYSLTYQGGLIIK